MLNKNDTVRQLIAGLANEGVDLEFKEASGGLPNSMWETVSAFANTSGGVIILGVAENRGEFVIKGVSNAVKLQTEFWNAIRNPKKISSFSISSSAYEIFSIEEGKDIVSITIPEAKFNELPVHINGDLRKTFIRKGEGDYMVTDEELKIMIRNSSQGALDMTPLKELGVEHLDPRSVSRFKDLVAARYPDGGYEKMDSSDFLIHLGLLDALEGEKPCLYSGTLLMFGKYNVIRHYYNHFHLDYFDYRGGGDRWSDRVSTDDLGFGEMNIFTFFDLVSLKLAAAAKSPFKLDENLVRVNTDMATPLREALVNALVHADYSIPYGTVKIEVYDGFFRFTNPGKLIIPTVNFFAGGLSKVRNDAIMLAFRRMGLCERQGYGGWSIFKAASDNGYRAPAIETDLEKTTLTIWTVDLPSSYPDLSVDEREVLSFIAHSGSVGKSSLKAAFPSLTDYSLNQILAGLCALSLVQVDGAGRATRYSLAVKSAERAGQLRLMVERLIDGLAKLG